VLEEKKAIPAVDALFDSAKLVAALPAADTAAPNEMVFTVIPGGRADVRNVDSTNTLSSSVETGAQLAAWARPASRSFAPAFKVRVLLGAAGNPFSMNIERSVLCGPEMIGPPQPVTLNRVIPAGPGSGPPTRPRSVTPRVRVGVDGLVRRVDLGSGSGDRDFDRAVQDASMRQRYKPAMLDGRPVEVWIGQGRLEIAR
jgi:hypothetical protein